VTDSNLVQQALAGDPEAFAALVHRHGPGLYARLLRQVRSPAEAEDLLQEVLLRAYARLEQVQDPSRLGAWLGVLADNQVRQWRRRRWVQLRWQEQLSASGERLFLPAEEPSPLAEQKALVRAALSRLSAAYRQVLVHHYLKGYSYQETAQRLGLPVETVRSRLQKGRKLQCPRIYSRDLDSLFCKTLKEGTLKPLKPSPQPSGSPIAREAPHPTHHTQGE
jgi:RNA polymerase sigma-70 factor (ECF subfamily)